MRIAKLSFLEHWLLFLLGSHLIRTAIAVPKPPKVNVLILTADDLGDEQVDLVAEYNHPLMQYLGKNAVRFKRAEAAMGVCAPSRAAILFGFTIDQMNGVTFDTDDVVSVAAIGGGETMFGMAAAAGYTTTTRGKIPHPNRDEDMYLTGQYTEPSLNFDAGSNNECGKNKIACILDERIDMQIAATCIELLQGYAKHPTKHFMLGCGFHNPHYPWRSSTANFKLVNGAMPAEFLDVTLTEQYIAAIMATKDLRLPIQGPDVNNVSAWEVNYNNFNAGPKLGPTEVPVLGGTRGAIIYKSLSKLKGQFTNKKINKAALRQFVRGAVLTVFDDIYSVILQVEALNIPNLLIIFLGDHGIGYGQIPYDFHKNLGWGSWSKNRLLPQISAIPLFFVYNGLTDVGAPNKVSYVPVQAIDIRTTIESITGLKPAATKLKRLGKDLTAWLKDPDASYSGIYSITQYPRAMPGLVQVDPLMTAVAPLGACAADNPASGRQPWCAMSYKLHTSYEAIEYDLYMLFPYYEVRQCFNPVVPFAVPQSELFDGGEESWQLMPGSCPDLDNPYPGTMLISNQAAQLGQNLLFEDLNIDPQQLAASKQIAAAMLKLLIKDRQYANCNPIPKTSAHSRCVI